MWSGSEVLWTNTALSFLDERFSVGFATRYDAPKLQALKEKGARFYPLRARPGFLARTMTKLRMKKRPEPVADMLKRERPHLVVISQGNNIESADIMRACREARVTYVTLTQLVAAFQWIFVNDKKIEILRDHYAHAAMNYFVSRDNLKLHLNMLADDATNVKVVNNFFTVDADVNAAFPAVDGEYHVAAVGRLEIFHKGLDLLLEVLGQDKWKERPLIVHLYGEGPHQETLKRLADAYGIRKVIFEGHVNAVDQIWKHCQLLVLPSRMEGQSVALIEAMWCSRAAVVTDLGGARDLIQDGVHGFIANHPTVDALDDAMERAWAARGQWHVFGERAGKHIRGILRQSPVRQFADELKGVMAIGGQGK
jgi:glycosyltransferase involved in cell wall biosynthesis